MKRKNVRAADYQLRSTTVYSLRLDLDVKLRIPTTPIAWNRYIRIGIGRESTSHIKTLDK